MDDYENTSNQLARVARKLRGGDLSLAPRVIQLRQDITDSEAKIQQKSSRMTPPQAQRFAALSAKAAPYMQP